MSTTSCSRILASAAIAMALALVMEGCGGGGGGSSKIEGTCGPDTSYVSDCQNVDYGSCGNACCNLMLTVKETPDAFVTALKSAVTSNGLAGQFTLQETAAGKVGFDDLSNISAVLPEPFKGSKSVFIGQLHHVTDGATPYTDTINFNIRNGTGNSSIVNAFSLSLIGGALSDNGQNYKNIMLLLDGLNYTVTEHLNNSCPAKKFKELREQPAESVTVARVLATEAAAAKPKPSKAAAKVPGTCGKEKPSPVVDCQNVDYGSCGNACCSMLMHQHDEPAVAMKALNDTFANGGPDGFYTLQLTAQGSLGFANLTKYRVGMPIPFGTSTHGLYLGQVHHMTNGSKHFNDTIDFVIFNDATAGSYISATSVSLVGGALGDNGQNYKNIVMAMDAAFGVFQGHRYWQEVGRYFNSCPASTAPLASEVLV